MYFQNVCPKIIYPEGFSKNPFCIENLIKRQLILYLELVADTLRPSLTFICNFYTFWCLPLCTIKGRPSHFIGHVRGTPPPPSTPELKKVILYLYKTCVHVYSTHQTQGSRQKIGRLLEHVRLIKYWRAPNRGDALICIFYFFCNTSRLLVFPSLFATVRKFGNN